jgi:hypothetical protein
MLSRMRRLLLLCAMVIAGCSSTTSLPSDRAQLLELHEKALRAHREQSIEMLLEDEVDDYVVASRGEIHTPPKNDRKANMGPYLRRTMFSSYADTREPIVKVSADGTLGWVIVRIAARGVQEGEPLEFTSAWIELYEKRNGRWLRVGNVSNFKE